MKDSTKDKVEGVVHDAKGKLKEKIGRATNNPDLEAEGQDEKMAERSKRKLETSKRSSRNRGGGASGIYPHERGAVAGQQHV